MLKGQNILTCPCNQRKQFKRQRDLSVLITTYGTTATSVERNVVNDTYWVIKSHKPNADRQYNGQ